MQHTAAQLEVGTHAKEQHQHGEVDVEAVGDERDHVHVAHDLRKKEGAINLLWLSELLNLVAFLGTAESEVHIVHISCVIVVYTLTHCGQVTHICFSKLTIISSDNGLSPDWRQAIIWTNAGV